MEATMIDLKRKVVDIRHFDEVIPVWVNEDESRMISDTADLNSPEMVTLKKKLYRGIEVVFPRKPGERSRSRLYYINMDDFKEAVPLLQSVIRDATAKIRKENHRILVELKNTRQSWQLCEQERNKYEIELLTLKSKWYVKAAKWFEKVFKRK